VVFALAWPVMKTAADATMDTASVLMFIFVQSMTLRTTGRLLEPDFSSKRQSFQTVLRRSPRASPANLFYELAAGLAQYWCKLLGNSRGEHFLTKGVHMCAGSKTVGWKELGQIGQDHVGMDPILPLLETVQVVRM